MTVISTDMPTTEFRERPYSYNAHGFRFLFPAHETLFGRNGRSADGYSGSRPVVCTIELDENEVIIYSSCSGYILRRQSRS
jgi:hypothetical protein